tara:strand:- start:98 stop:604 length:507 start_codon:yes stop_codon:yes gene_type:complete
MVNENTIENNYGYSKKEIDEIIDEQNELVIREEIIKEELTKEGNFGYSNNEINEILEEQKELKLREESEEFARKEEEKEQKWWDNMIKGAEEIAKQQEKDDHEHWMKHGDPDQQQARYDEKMAKLEQEEWDNDVSRNYFGGFNDDPNIDYNSTYADPEDESSVEDFLD